MTNTITNRQLFFILLMTITCYSVVIIPKAVTETAGTGGWIPILILSVIIGAATAGLVYLNSLFKDKMLFDYAPELITKPISCLVVLYYIAYFFLILVFLTTEKAKLLKGDFFPNTPLWFIPLFGITVFCFVSYKGITTVARLTELIGVVFIITATFVHILMITEGQMNRILPLFNPAEIGSYLKALTSTEFAFIPPSILLAIPFTKQNGNKSIKTAFFSLLAIGLFYVLILESCIMKVGANDIVNYEDPLIVAIRDTSPKALEFLARLDILYLTVGFMGLFMGATIIMTVIVDYLCRIFSRLSRLVIVIAVGAATYGAFLIVIGIKEFEHYIRQASTVFLAISSILIPGILIIIAKAKGRKVRKDA